MRPAERAELPRLAAVLAEAFDDYPWTRWTVDVESHAERLAQLQQIYLEHAHAHGGRIWTVDELDAVAVLVPAGMPDPPESVLARVVELHGDGFARIVEHEQCAAPVRPEADWTLATVAVAARRQGQGVGGRLVQHALDDVRPDTVALETSLQRNLALYRRLGFEQVAHLSGPGPDVWFLVTPGA